MDLVKEWTRRQNTPISLLPIVDFLYFDEDYDPPMEMANFIHHKCLPCLLCSRRNNFVSHPCIASLPEPRYDTDVPHFICDQFHSNYNWNHGLRIYIIWDLWEQNDEEQHDATFIEWEQHTMIKWIPEEVLQDIVSFVFEK